MQVPAVGAHMWGLMWQAQQNGAPAYLTSFEKTFLPLPRLVHVLALAHVLSCFPLVRRACAPVILAAVRQYWPKATGSVGAKQIDRGLARLKRHA